jgi:truncated hemoglobin YjbI
MKSVFYERLFLLNRCLEQVGEILEQFRQDEVIHPVFASDRQRAVEDLRADLSHVLTGMLHRRELEECVGLAQKQIEQEGKAGSQTGTSSA